ncbi:hypothetical protein B0920_00110 [Massilia sp. KIM]|jgi:hypothetical protein|uniref:hypothetical protein n=1 Tax=Massilia sp. KIM TaxID=1955422 RepID=UPI00098FD250|nr:hypothetical protein [Massilia sp. KIM]OON61945.1 hypothetical protein B0920_00110 [Massilia sp. KIM]
MTSANFHVCYASVANALFEHIEQDLLLLTTALLDDDEPPPLRPLPDCLPPPRPVQWEMPPL